MPNDLRKMRYTAAINEALRWSLDTDPQVLFFGEDVAIPGGPFGTSQGLYDDFGDRVFDTPISESAIIGSALGAAMRGMRPVVEIMYMDFILVAMDQIVNQVANTRYVSRSGWTAPLTIRTQQGYSPGACAQHSQSLEALFAHTPGLRVGLPSNPGDAYSMLRAAIMSDDPVLVIDARMLYPDSGNVELTAPVEAIGGARVTRSGSDVTIVSWSRMAKEANIAAETLSAEGIEADVVDLRWLNPLDFETVATSIAHTSRLVVAHEAGLTGGFGAEIAARAATECYWDLDGPVIRIGAPDVRVPAAPHLQKATIPTASWIVEAIRAMS